MNREERSILGVTMLGHAMVHTYELSIPVLIPIWLDVFSVTPAVIGVVVAAGYALFGLGGLPSGIFADAYGSRTLILVCLLGMCASFLALSLAPSVPVLVLALVLWGAAASLYHPSGLALISKGIEQRGTALGYHGMAGNVGIALGPLATLLLLVAFDWRVVVALLAIPAGVAVVMVLLTDLEEDNPVEATDGGVLGDADISLSGFLATSRLLFGGGFALVFAFIMVQGLYYRGTLTFLPDLLEGFSTFAPVTSFGRTFDPSRYLYAGLLLIGVVGQYAGGRLSDRIRVEHGLAGVFAGLGIIAALFVPAAETGMVALLLISGVLGVFIFAVQPFLQAAVAEYSPPEARGLSYGYMYAGVFGVGSLGAAITGFILTYGTPRHLFAALVCFELVNLTLVYALLRGWRPLGRFA